MIKNYLITAFRNLTKDGAYAIINVIGLTVGIACCILVATTVIHELSYDRYHANGDRVYRLIRETVMQSRKNTFSYGVQGPLPIDIAEALPTVEKGARYYHIRKMWTGYERKFSRYLGIVDDDFLDMLTFTPIQGDFKSLQTVPNSVAISRETATLFFGEDDPIGKTLSSEYKYFIGDYQVVAVYQNPPLNSDFRFHILTTTIGSNQWIQGVWNQWRPKSEWRPTNGFLLLRADADPADVERALPDFLAKKYGKEFAAENKYHLQPLHSIHLHAADYGLRRSGDFQHILILIGAATFVLLIACINYVNLATARSMTRSQEVGLRKVLGARRHQLFAQYMGEAIFTALLAMFIAVLITESFGTQAAAVTGKYISVLEYLSFDTVLLLTLFATLIGLGAGFYPATVLANLSPTNAMKVAHTGRSRLSLRKGLVVTQFMLSIVLVTSTFVVKNQMDFMRERKLGFDRDLVVVTRFLNAPHLVPRWEEVKNRFVGHPDILNVSVTSTYVGIWGEYGQIKAEGHNEGFRFYYMSVDHDFLDMFGIQLLAGRNVPEHTPPDNSQSFLLNESAVRELGWDKDGINPIGKRITYDVNDDIRLQGTVGGVVKDFHSQSLHHAVEPMFLVKSPRSFRSILFKMRGTNIKETMAYLKKTWEDLRQDQPFSASFLDEELERQYWREQRTAEAFQNVSTIAMIIAGLGMLGLVSYTTQRRTKEIGIRKVIGASEGNILWLLMRESIILIAVAGAIALPATYLWAQDWLAGFAYRTGLSLSVMAPGIAIALLIGVAAVGWQAIRAARLNPVDALRHE